MAEQTFQQWLARESLSVNQALAREVDSLPEPARPAARHILEAGGKRLRPMLTVLCGRLFGYGGNDIYRLASSMELLHAATLLHDDILDNAESRRGLKAAHLIYGAAATILSGDALLAHGNAIVASFDKPPLCLCFSRATIQTAAGEILEMNSLGNPDLTHAQYLEIAKGKTGCLISQSCMMGALAAGAACGQAEKCASFGENLGVAFQIVDDALDFAPAAQTGKPTGGDLREGKMTPPLRLYRESLAPQQRSLFDKAFRQKKFSDAQAGEIIQDTAAFVPASICLADAFLEKARQALDSLPTGGEKTILLQLVDYVRNRSK